MELAKKDEKNEDLFKFFFIPFLITSFRPYSAYKWYTEGHNCSEHGARARITRFLHLLEQGFISEVI